MGVFLFYTQNKTFRDHWSIKIMHANKKGRQGQRPIFRTTLRTYAGKLKASNPGKKKTVNQYIKHFDLAKKKPHAIQES